ncbi:MAG: DUF3500 domain-containing protein, partial [Chloroflexota bacterium]|nr:DUF3500 domain-containing protein [Chloroflexota bacterium]
AATVAGDTTSRVVAAANAFLTTLNDVQRTQAVFDFNNAGAKSQSSNLPPGLFNWVGVRMGDLSDAQQQAVLGAQTIDLVLGANQPVRTVPPEGIRTSALNAEQQGLLLDLVGEYVGLLNEEDAAIRRAEVQGSLADTYFAWYGPTTSNSAAYFHIQGPTLWIEFSPQGPGPGGQPGGGRGTKPSGGAPPQGGAPTGAPAGTDRADPFSGRHAAHSPRRGRDPSCVGASCAGRHLAAATGAFASSSRMATVSFGAV